MLKGNAARRALATVAAIPLVLAVSACGTQLSSGGSAACAPGLARWLEEVSAQEVMQAPVDAVDVVHSGTVNCRALPIIGIIGSDPVVELKTSYSSEESEEQIAVRLRNAAGLADWETFTGGGDCLVRVIDGVPSFLTVATSETNFAVTIRRDDPSICFSDATPSPGETPA